MWRPELGAGKGPNMPAQLIALTEGPNILLDKPILLLGRHPECDIQIESRKISRRHCCIAQVDDYLVVRDLGSTNGIRINGVRVLEGRLRATDELTIGNSRYKVRWDPTEPSNAANEPASRKQERAPRSGRAEVVDDDALESCDEPIPLDDSDLNEAAPLKAAPAPQPAPAKPPLDERPDPIILPDDLELAPVSDVIPPPEPH
jgi:pSer/pThr/pTyr-binding forkhead associated (FHA) protein